MPLIIPQFSLEQEDKHIIVNLRLPYVKPTKSEFSILGKSFSFYLKPYLLQLTFNEILKDSEQPAKAIYDPQQFNLKVYLEKLNHGEQFTQLDMIGLIMNKKKKSQQKDKKPKGQLIQVLENNPVDDSQPELLQDFNEQNSYQNPFLYGFNNQYKDVFDDLEEELLEISILDPKQIAQQDRQALSLQYIQKSFDEEVYIFDLLENEEIDDFLEWNMKITDQFSIQQINRLNKFEKREYIIESKEQCLFGLVDILFAYLYELIVFQGELTLESAVTINSLSSQFQAFYTSITLKDVLVNNFQRALTFPMLRSFELCQKTKLLLQEIINQKIQVIKILLEVEFLFSKSKPRNYLNFIYIDDFIIWTQTVDNDDLKQLSKSIKQIEIQKEDLQLNLPTIEKEAIKQAFSS